jgi:hypothetical protein
MEEKHFNEIKEKYDLYERNRLKNGKFLSKDTVVGYWGVTPLAETYELFKRINLGSHDNFLDLGSGDGRIVLLASLFGVKSHGIEFDSDLVNSSLLLRRKIDLEHFKNTKIIHNNFMEHDFSKYNVIFVSPDKPFRRKGFEKKLVDEMKGELIVHGWEFHPKYLEKKEEHIIDGEKFIIYRND